MSERRRLRGAEHRPLRGYAPLFVLLAALAVMVVVVPSTVPDDDASAAGSGPAEVAGGRTASGWGTGVTACTDRDEQLEGHEYTPPCFAWGETADNGGETAPGVTADEIVVSYRIPTDQDILQWFAQLGGVPLDASNEQLKADVEALVDWVNANFQLYGRRIRLIPYEGRGQILPELQQAGQDAATNDSIRAASEIGAFADLSAITQPYADALTRNGVIAIGAPYMSREWYAERRPYAWSTVPDCTSVAERSVAYSNRRLFGRNALFAGDGHDDQVRTMAVIAPNNREYQQCVDVFEDGIEAEGHEILRLDYTIDAARLQTQASDIAARLRSAGVTSVSCSCDPIMQMYLAEQMQSQGMVTEWLISGVGFIDLDVGGQIISARAPDQWARAFGGSPTAAPQPPETSASYAAFRSVRPEGEPSDELQILYERVLLLAIGLQMAGPDLTAGTFEAGLVAWPGGDGQAGHWQLGPDDYTPVTDLRELWWDPTAVSPVNGEQGSYVDAGERWTPESIPGGDPEVLP
jgi:hypothetical protein